MAQLHSDAKKIIEQRNARSRQDFKALSPKGHNGGFCAFHDATVSWLPASDRVFATV